MKKEEIKLLNATIRIIIGVMLFVLFWFNTLGYIKIVNSFIGLFTLISLSVYFLLTGASNSYPLINIIRRVKR